MARRKKKDFGQGQDKNEYGNSSPGESSRGFSFKGKYRQETSAGSHFSQRVFVGKFASEGDRYKVRQLKYKTLQSDKSDLPKKGRSFTGRRLDNVRQQLRTTMSDQSGPSASDDSGRATAAYVTDKGLGVTDKGVKATKWAAEAAYEGGQWVHEKAKGKKEKQSRLREDRSRLKDRPGEKTSSQESSKTKEKHARYARSQNKEKLKERAKEPDYSAKMRDEPEYGQKRQKRSDAELANAAKAKRRKNQIAKGKGSFKERAKEGAQRAGPGSTNLTKTIAGKAVKYSTGAVWLTSKTVAKGTSEDDDKDVGFESKAIFDSASRLGRSVKRGKNNKLGKGNQISKRELKLKAKKSKLSKSGARVGEETLTSKQLQKRFIGRRNMKKLIKAKRKKGRLKKAREAASKFANKVASKGKIVIGIAILAILLASVIIGSCSSGLGALGSGGAIVGTSYQADDKDVTGAENEMTLHEAELQLEIMLVPQNHPDADEINYDLDPIGHDPHLLLAYLTTKYQDFKVDEVKGEVESIFNEMYDLEIKERIEKRTFSDVDANGNKSFYQKNYKIVDVILRTKDMDQVLRGRLNSEDEEIYDDIVEYKGNFEELESPVEGDWKPRIKAMYGWRVDPMAQIITFNDGIDIFAGSGSPVLAVFDGIVTDASGGMVEITHEKGMKAQYINVSPSVSVGQAVKAGDTVGSVYATSDSEGSFLHFKYYVRLPKSKALVQVNPYFYLTSDSPFTFQQMPAQKTGSPNPGGGGQYQGNFDNPGIAYDDEQVQKLFDYANQYLGLPYVFGGKNPNVAITLKDGRVVKGLDCSGFVSWVLRGSGVVPGFGSYSAQGLFDVSKPVSAGEAKPGDLVFFTGTYDAGVPVTHVGIYAGNGKMLHTGGAPGVEYSDLNNAFWQNHFYSYGRIN